LHSFCAERGHAPEIRGFKQLPGGWFAIAMDYVPLVNHSSQVFPPVHPSQSPHLTHLLNTWILDLQKLVQSFHDEGLVHGDLREANMLCDGERVMLVDFDWGGEVGKACYPHARLCSELRNGRGGGNPVITKEDDRRVIHDTFEVLKRIVATVVT
jgi:serine/threonine protein kinase